MQALVFSRSMPILYDSRKQSLRRATPGWLSSPPPNSRSLNARWRRCCGLALITLLLAGELTWANEITGGVQQRPGVRARLDAREEAEVEFEFDDPPKIRYRITDSLRFGAKAKAELQWQENLNLDKSDNENLLVMQLEAKVAFRYEPNEHIHAYTELELAKEYLLEHKDNERARETQLLLKQAYVTFPNFYPGFSVKIGRQRYRDEREWWYDAALDGIRLFARRARFGVEASASRKEIVGDDLLNDDRQERVNNYILLGRYAYAHYAEVDAYVFVRDDQTDKQEDPVFIGVRGIGELNSRTDYWVDAALVRGTDRGRDIRAYGFDLGATYKFKRPLKPALTLSAAFGTGDPDPNDDVNREFRQTGLQDNSANFNGLTRFKYYGEVFDPELSNLWILTAAIGIRPAKNASVDLVYHYYRQDHASDEFRDVALDEDPDGRNPEVGQALDLIFGYKPFKRTSVKLKIGSFFPGNAFASDADNAYVAELELGYRF